jgi:hypothetical protein
VHKNSLDMETMKLQQEIIDATTRSVQTVVPTVELA